MQRDERQRSGVLTIPIHGIEEKEYPFSFETNAAELQVDDHFGGEITVHGTLVRVGSQFHVDGRVQATRTGECDRCLAETEEGVEQGFHLTFSAAEDTDEESGLISLPADAADIILDDEVRQVLRLEVPMKNLCTEDCAGLCPRCGADRNTDECSCETETIDPRWAELKSLFGDKSDENQN